MDKKMKIIIIIMAVLIVVLIIVGVLSFSNYNKEDGQNSSVPNTEIYSSDGVILEGGDEMINNYSSWEEVLNKIQEEYVDDTVTVSFDREENECWYFSDSLQREYVYCLANPSILQLEKVVEETDK